MRECELVEGITDDVWRIYLASFVINTHLKDQWQRKGKIFESKL